MPGDGLRRPAGWWATSAGRRCPSSSRRGGSRGRATPPPAVNSTARSPPFGSSASGPSSTGWGSNRRIPTDFEADLARTSCPRSWFRSASASPSIRSSRRARASTPSTRCCGRSGSRPQIWRKTVVIVNHDENGGFFDHVAPPTPPPGTKGEYLTVEPLAARRRRHPRSDRPRLPRPCIIVSPWSRGGFVCSDTFDHTSVLRLMSGASAPRCRTSPHGGARSPAT